MNTKPKIVAIIPCYNTAAQIAAVVSSARQYVDEVIVVDDGSTDATAEIAREAGARVISHGKNLGKGAAMKTGVNQVDDSVIVFIDGDGQHDTDKIPNLIAPILENGVDVVVGSRFLSKSKLCSPPITRNFANLIASVVISIFVSVSFARKRKAGLIKLQNKSRKSNYRIVKGPLKWFTDCTCGLRAIRTQGWHMLSIISNGYQIETELIFEFVKNGLLIAEIPVDCTWKDKLSKLSIIRDGTKTIALIMKKMIKG